MKIRRANMSDTVVEINLEEMNHRHMIAINLAKLYRRNKFYIGSTVHLRFQGEIISSFRIVLDKVIDNGPFDFTAKGNLIFANEDKKDFEVKIRRHERSTSITGTDKVNNW